MPAKLLAFFVWIALSAERGDGSLMIKNFEISDSAFATDIFANRTFIIRTSSKSNASRENGLDEEAPDSSKTYSGKETFRGVNRANTEKITDTSVK